MDKKTPDETGAIPLLAVQSSSSALQQSEPCILIYLLQDLQRYFMVVELSVAQN